MSDEFYSPTNKYPPPVKTELVHVQRSGAIECPKYKLDNGKTSTYHRVQGALRASKKLGS